MTEWVTIRVPEPNRDDAKDIRPNDATHGDCLVAGAKALADGNVDTDSTTDVEDLSTNLNEEIIDKQQQALEYQEKTIEELEKQRELLVDFINSPGVVELEATERKKIAEEVAEMMR